MSWIVIQQIVALCNFFILFPEILKKERNYSLKNMSIIKNTESYKFIKL